VRHEKAACGIRKSFITRSSQQSCANIDLVPISKAWLSANRTLDALNMTPTTKNEAFTIPNPTVCATTQNAILENRGPAHWTTKNAGACILDQRRSSFIYLASDRGNATPPTMPLTLKHDLKHNPLEEEPFCYSEFSNLYNNPNTFST
jgi:hypothetical protein